MSTKTYAGIYRFADLLRSLKVDNEEEKKIKTLLNIDSL
jgi:hypothetical protein